MKTLAPLTAVLSAAALVAAIAVAPAQAAHLDNPNLLVDPSFEGAPTFDGPPFVGSWEAFTSGGPTNEFSTTMPRTGAQAMELNIVNEANAFVGAFQDVQFGFSLAGTDSWFSGWHKALTGPGGSEIRIEWRDSVNDVEISRTANLTPSIGTEYEEFIVAAAIPAGADTARLTYAAQSFGGPPLQQVFVDDVNFNIAGVPEPTSLVCAAMGLLAVGFRRVR